MPTPTLPGLAAILGANTATGDYIIWYDIDEAGNPKEKKITRAELALALVAAGLVKVDGSGNIVTAGIIPRTGTAAAINAIVLADGEIATTTDTDEVRKGDGVTAGGIRLTGTYQLDPITVETDSYQLPYARDLYVGDPDLTTLPNEFYPIFLFAPGASYGLGDRIRVYIHKSTGKTLVGQMVLALDDGSGNAFFAIYDAALLGYAYVINATAEEGVYIDMEVATYESGVPVWKIKELTNCELVYNG